MAIQRDAFAKAAALRLGPSLNRAGSVGEVGALLFEGDLEEIRSWIRASSSVEVEDNVLS